MSRGAGLCLFSPKMSDDMVETARSWGMEEHSLNLFQGMESSRSWGCHHSDIGDNLGKTVFTYLSTELLASMCSCCDIAYAFVSCETLPEADGNEYVSGFCFVLLHGFSCYNQKLPIVYHVEWLLAIVPCKYTLEWTCLFFCASSTFTQNEQLWGDYLSEKSLTFELVFNLLVQVAVSLGHKTQPMFCKKSRMLAGIVLQLYECYFFPRDNSSTFFHFLTEFYYQCLHFDSTRNWLL